ncbi:MAG: hypothetical protein HQ566_02090 [Candidatus Omnitrophica bacterium]|nr:hypothetical protein [Candidatus Omnitrophota bacterium]
MKFKTSLFLLILSCLIYTISADEACSQEEEWGVLSSRFCTVFFEEGVDLNTVNRRINLRFADFYNPRRYRDKADLSTEEILAEKFDSIFSRVEDILDMYPSMVQVTINIYRTKGGLDEAYEDIFDEPNEASSFYIYKTNTIYTTERAINEGMLAHEMAHCIIDHYFVILPPRKIQEMLAVYTDVHLKD